MSRLRFCLAVVPAFLCLGRAAAQQPPEPARLERNERYLTPVLQEDLDRQRAMYEDIEVMRRLLGGRLAAAVPSVAAAGACTQCHQMPLTPFHNDLRNAPLPLGLQPERPGQCAEPELAQP